MATSFEFREPIAFTPQVSSPFQAQLGNSEAFNFFRSPERNSSSEQNPEFLNFKSPFAPTEGSLPSVNTPEGKELRTALESPGALNFSTPVDNAASGKKPDYKIVEENGKPKLVKVGDGDPMADGKLNIEIDTGNKSLAESIKNADKNLKQLVKDLISYWTKNHPGTEIPAWMQGILDSQPFIPEGQSSPTPISSNPNQASSPVEQPPAQSASPSWQGDYRSGGGNGYSPDYGGSLPSNSESYYRGGGEDNSWSVPSEAPNFGESPFVDKLVKTLMANEGALNGDGTPKFTAFNPDDNGGISVGLRQWHAGGALPELLNAWKAEDPQKFEQYFKGHSPDQINNMSSAEFANSPGMTEGMKAALADPEYQKVQTRLIEDWVKREVKTGMDLGLTGETELAVFVDVSNQYGQDTATRAASIGKADGDQGKQMNDSARGGQYAERFARIEENFSENSASLTAKAPAASGFNARLADAIEVQDANMAGTGRCAAAVQVALRDAGLGEFMGSGNGWDMLGPLKSSGKFVEISQNQATRGDIIVRPPSAAQDDSVYGDISVVTSNNGGVITQTNDASYQFHNQNSRYDDKAVFLRYVGDKSQTEVTDNSEAAKKEEPAKEKKNA
ncbi:MAG: hypothetical protein IAF58_19990 [Leptolyngbya sp.]|nr:hypothetical protein [Candidatus Melainabacteria bacterium]